jgi:hypothetical protein
MVPVGEISGEERSFFDLIVDLRKAQFQIVYWPAYPALLTFGNCRILQVGGYSDYFQKYVKLVPEKTGEPGVVEVLLEELAALPGAIGPALEALFANAQSFLKKS